MKYLLTESQINKFIDQVIQETIQELRDECEDYDEATEPGDWYNWDDCDAVYILEKLVVNDIETTEPYKTILSDRVYPKYIVWTNIYYHSLMGNVRYDWDNMASLLMFRIFQKYKIVLQIIPQKKINTNTNVQW